MAGSGHGQSVKFGTTTIPGVESVKSNLKGQIQTKVVADQQYPIAITIPGQAKWSVTFNLPETGAHTLLAALAFGLVATFEHDDVDGVKYTATGAISAGYDVSADSGGWVTITWEVVANGAVSVAAATP